ncbi:hypothetical protein [Alkalicoccobacillus gibsonii]|uniref:hypothetical protein n=1 Tax=Alkalicoccobacillus gibsonii TaxID=79881 RepID=UPI001932A090|nr:hypothetical protein [Alkalicoccobacillus gibsonii]MBM0065908.1 hypothetical protein [Alkalicoccobacillus gibsonii]
MTQCIYIASPVKLPKGNVERSSMIEKYTTNEMSSYLFFENNYNDLLKRKESLSIHFSYDYQVSAETNALPLRFQEKGTIEEKICLDILYQYLNHALQESGVLEMFTCLSG